jgi:hypothetical protein
MKQDSQETHPEHPQEAHGSHRVGTLREHLVRETLSDLENELTADHHLDEESGAVLPAHPPDRTDPE